MRVPRFWHRESIEVAGRGGTPWRMVCWGWSDHDVQEAHMRAVQKAERVKLRWRPDSQRQDTSWYSSGDYQADPPREELIDEVTDENGTVIGIVTRNAYGSLVLNTDRLLIVHLHDRLTQTDKDLPLA